MGDTKKIAITILFYPSKWFVVLVLFLWNCPENLKNESQKCVAFPVSAT